MKRNAIALFVFFLLILPVVVFPQQEDTADQKKVVSESSQAGSEEAKKRYMELQQKMAEATKESREKIGKLVREHDELLLKNAPPSEVDAKVQEINEVQKTMTQIMQSIAPQGMPQVGGAEQHTRTLSTQDQEELKSLIEERRQKIVGGAGHQEVADLTEKIRKIYSPEPPPSSAPPLAPGAQEAQAKH